MLPKFFGNRLISKGRWPPCNNFLWVYMKDRVFKDLPAFIPELKVKIQEINARIDRPMLKRVFQNKFCRVNACLETNGGQFEHLLKLFPK